MLEFFCLRTTSKLRPRKIYLIDSKVISGSIYLLSQSVFPDFTQIKDDSRKGFELKER